MLWARVSDSTVSLGVFDRDLHFVLWDGKGITSSLAGPHFLIF